MTINPKSKYFSSLTTSVDNYITFHHTGKSYVIPVDPDSVADQMSASFASNFPLSRSAPIYSYQNSGPRTVQVSFTLHRDLCKEFNPDTEDMVEELINNLEGMVLPDYNEANKIGSAAFLAPEIVTSPASEVPPWITNWSIKRPYLLR